MKKKQENRGGKREGAGRKNPGYETKTIAFRVPIQFVEPLKKLVKATVEKWLRNSR